MIELLHNIENLPENNTFRRLVGLAAYYKRTYEAVWIGVTVNPEKTARHYGRVKDCHWEKMILRYTTDDKVMAKAVESWMAWNKPDYAAFPTNLPDGETYYVYAVMGWNVIKPKFHRGGD